jgi:hypothetical protein
MPFTPFIGLSVFFHIGIISWKKFFDSESDLRVHSLDRKRVTMTTWYIGCFIILCIFTFVITTAFFLVRASVESPYSSVSVVEKESVVVERFVETETPHLGITLDFLRNQAMPAAAFTFATVARNEANQF